MPTPSPKNNRYGNERVKTQRGPQSGISMSGGKFETVNYQYPMICLPVPVQILPSCVNGFLTSLWILEMGKVKNALLLLYIVFTTG
jgi:hypothetical protein